VVVVEAGEVTQDRHSAQAHAVPRRMEMRIARKGVEGIKGKDPEYEALNQ